MSRILVLASAFVLLFGRAPAADPAPVQKVSAVKLVEAFMTNEAYADENFVDKQVELTGKVARISRSKYGGTSRGESAPYILELDLGGAESGKKIDLDLLISFEPKQRAQLAKLKPGDAIIIRGECGKRFVWSAKEGSRDKDYSQVWLKNCTFVENRASIK